MPGHGAVASSSWGVEGEVPGRSRRAERARGPAQAMAAAAPAPAVTWPGRGTRALWPPLPPALEETGTPARRRSLTSCKVRPWAGTGARPHPCDGLGRGVSRLLSKTPWGGQGQPPLAPAGIAPFAFILLLLLLCSPSRAETEGASKCKHSAG